MPRPTFDPAPARRPLPSGRVLAGLALLLDGLGVATLLVGSGLEPFGLALVAAPLAVVLAIISVRQAGRASGAGALPILALVVSVVACSCSSPSSLWGSSCS